MEVGSGSDIVHTNIQLLIEHDIIVLYSWLVPVYTSNGSASNLKVKHANDSCIAETIHNQNDGSPTLSVLPASSFGMGKEESGHHRYQGLHQHHHRIITIGAALVTQLDLRTPCCQAPS